MGWLRGSLMCWRFDGSTLEGAPGPRQYGVRGEGHARWPVAGQPGEQLTVLGSLWPIHGVSEARGEMAGACDFHPVV